MTTLLEKGANFVWKNARLLDRAIFDYRLYGGSQTRIRDVLRAYQNEDGGFGHALEPDLRSPDSQPLFVEFALGALYDNKIHDPEMAYRACDFLAQHADLNQGIAMIFPSSRLYPRAPHMDNPASEQPSMDRLTGIVGLANWQGVRHPWLQKAVEVCLEHATTTPYDDAHTIGSSFCLVESLGNEKPAEQLFNKLARELLKARFYCPDVPVKTYGLTPLEFAPSPDSFCRRLFTDAQIEAHLGELEAEQEADGGWPILWEPPGEMARCEWRARKAVIALATLRAYGKI